MGKSKATLQEQLESVQRKLAQHLPNDKGRKSPNSGKDRMYRLLMRESSLEDQIFQTRKKNRKNQRNFTAPEGAVEPSDNSSSLV